MVFTYCWALPDWFRHAFGFLLNLKTILFCLLVVMCGLFWRAQFPINMLWMLTWHSLFLTSSVWRCHRCGQQTSVLQMMCSNWLKKKKKVSITTSVAIQIIFKLNPLQLTIYLVAVGFSSGVVLLCTVPQVVVVVEVEIRHEILVNENVWVRFPKTQRYKV